MSTLRKANAQTNLEERERRREKDIHKVMEALKEERDASCYKTDEQSSEVNKNWAMGYYLGTLDLLKRTCTDI